MPDDLVAILIEDDRWQGMIEREAPVACAAVLRHLGLPADGFEISLLACDDARIAALNADFRGKARATNVLSWPSEERAAATPGAAPDLPDRETDEPQELGDIAIAWETCTGEAEAAGKPLPQHVRHLLVHATLHLLGYDHEDDADAALMEEVETRILVSLGDPDPY